MKKNDKKTAPSPRTRKSSASSKTSSRVERKLVGVRIEPRLIKVMKAIAEYHDVAVGELIEQVFWSSMEGGNFFSEKGKLSPEMRARIDSLKSVYGVTYDREFLQNTTTATPQRKTKK